MTNRRTKYRMKVSHTLQKIYCKSIVNFFHKFLFFSVVDRTLPIEFSYGIR